MSRGQGAIERRTADLFAATRDRGLTVAELADFAFQLDGATATRAQRLSATRAGHRLIRRMKEADETASRLIDEAHRETEAVVGPRPKYPKSPMDEAAAYKAYLAYDAAFKATEAYGRGMKLHAFNDRFGSWMRILPVKRRSIASRLPGRPARAIAPPFCASPSRRWSRRSGSPTG
jgi:hypothetical protein